MATIVSTNRQNGELEADSKATTIVVDGDPAAAAGTSAALGTVASADDGTGVWFKAAASDTAWTKLATV